ncbi:MAG TPA: glycosyl hydrolase family 28-related protein [Blastocatellia bacterium]|nr:glycosyl hydrolase family 28-related protein [Blastocatellia bacterium]
MTTLKGTFAMPCNINRSGIISLLAIIFAVSSGSLVYGQNATVAGSGMSRLSVEPANGSDPIAVGDNDPRVNVYRNIVSFGAKGDGTTDNSAALQKAIDAGYAVLVPEGTFNFSSTLTLKKDSSILGVGKRSVLRYTGTGAAMREPIGSYQGGYDNLKLMNFTLTTNSASQSGIELTNNYQVTLSGLFIDGAGVGFKTAGIHIIGGTAATNSAIVRITDGEIWFCGDGIRVSGPGGAAGLWIERNHISGNTLGINQVLPNGAYPSTNFQIKNNVIEGNLNGAIQAQVLYASSITGNYFENIDNSNAVLIRIASNGFAQGIKIDENVFGGKKALFNIDMNGQADVTGAITNNVFAGASTAAIRVNTARGLVIMNNTLETGSVPTVVTVGDASRSVWVQDFNNASYFSGAGQAQPNLTVGGGLVLSNKASIIANAGGVESKTANGSAYVQHTAQSFKQAAGPSWTSGKGAPTAACTNGSLFTRTDGGAKTTLYVCEVGKWAAK